MRRILIGAIFGAVVICAPAQAKDRADCPKQLERSYSASYSKVKRIHGTRAPGRDIRHLGVEYNDIVFDATCGELRKSRKQLRQLLVQPKHYPLLVSKVGPPVQRPALVETSHTVVGSTGSCIASKESGGNPAAVSPGGVYKGKYQFDDPTWHAATGLPGSASSYSEATQDAAFANWYSKHPEAWPNTRIGC